MAILLATLTMPMDPSTSEAKKIVVIGGGAIGSSTAYFLTTHPSFDAELHSVVLLEADEIAGGSSGKAGGLVAEWATPKCLAPLSFETHAELARIHGGEKSWGHRPVHCADVELEARNFGAAHHSNGVVSKPSAAKHPSALDWLAPGVLKSYSEVGNLSNTAQVHPYLYTKTLVRLAEEKGARIIIGNATKINHAENDKAVASVSYTQNGTLKTIDATDVVVAAGPWTPRILPQVSLLTPRGHSVVVKTTSEISPFVLFPNITATKDNALYNFDTVYASGPDDYEVHLPSGTGDVEFNEKKCEEVWTAIKSVSQEIHDGEILVRQACYKPQIRQHDDGEEVGPMVGPVPAVRGLWLATGHDEWGMSNAPGTGVVMSEMILEGEARSADVTSLDPRNFLEDDGRSEF